jgi:hypothetical protein
MIRLMLKQNYIGNKADSKSRGRFGRFWPLLAVFGRFGRFGRFWPLLAA